MTNSNKEIANKNKYLKFQIITTFLTGIIISLFLAASTFSYILNGFSSKKELLPLIFLILCISGLALILINLVIYIVNYIYLRSFSDIKQNKHFIKYFILEFWFWILLGMNSLFIYLFFHNYSTNMIYIFLISLFIQLLIGIMLIINNVSFLIKFIKIINILYINKERENNPGYQESGDATVEFDNIID